MWGLSGVPGPGTAVPPGESARQLLIIPGSPRSFFPGENPLDQAGGLLSCPFGGYRFHGNYLFGNLESSAFTGVGNQAPPVTGL